MDPSEVRETYQQQVQTYLADIRRACNNSDAEYHTIMVQEPYATALVRLLSRRK